MSESMLVFNFQRPGPRSTTHVFILIDTAQWSENGK